MAVSAILKRAVTMTETCKTAGTDYVPISCALHSEYELAILRRQRLRLVWNDSGVIRDQAVQPLDLKTVNRDDSREGGGGTASGTAVEEFLICHTGDGTTQNIRLDRVLRVYPA